MAAVAPPSDAGDNDDANELLAADEADEQALEALAVDDYDEDDDSEEYEDDDSEEYEDADDDDSLEAAPPRMGIRLGASADLADLQEVSTHKPLDVIETHKSDNFVTDGKPLDSEVMACTTEEVPFQVAIESEATPPPPARPRRDRILPLLAALTSTAGMVAGGALVLVGFVALVSISATLSGDEDTELAAGADEEGDGAALDDGDGDGPELDEPDEPADGGAAAAGSTGDTGDAADGEDEEEQVKPAPRRRRRPKPEPEPEPEPEPKKKRGLFGRKNKK